MKDTLIIHNIHDKASREFVATYGNRNDVTVLEDDGLNVRIKYPYISVVTLFPCFRVKILTFISALFKVRKIDV